MAIHQLNNLDHGFHAVRVRDIEGCEECPAVVIIKDGKIYETLSDKELSKADIIDAINASEE